MAIFRQHSTRNLCGGQIDGLKFRQDKSTLKFDKMVAGLDSNQRTENRADLQSIWQTFPMLPICQ